MTRDYNRQDVAYSSENLCYTGNKRVMSGRIGSALQYGETSASRERTANSKMNGNNTGCMCGKIKKGSTETGLV